MAMMKLCRCGKLIEYNLKHCKECKELYSRDNKERQRLYNKYKRDEDTQKIYNDPRWEIMKAKSEHRDVGLCRLCLHSKTITVQQAVHHIIGLKENILKAFDLNNLICLCESCHQTVHSKYKKSNSTKIETQGLLFKLIVEGIKI